MPLDFQLKAAIIFLILLSVYVFLNRKKLDTHGFFPLFYFSMYKTKFGIRFMDSFSKKFRKPMIFIGYAGIVIGFVGMAILTFSLVQNIYNLFTKPEAAPGVGLVLPFEVKGAVYVPFFYWLIAIFIIALVHEFAHGIIARAHNMQVKSSGFAFLGILVPIIPAAFVEPDEKVLRKRPHKQQLSVFAAGPLANIILAFAVIGLSYFIISPIVENMAENKGVKITGFIEGDFPAQKSGISKNEVVTEIDGKKITTVDDFSSILQNKTPGILVELKTDKSSYSIPLGKNPEDEKKGYLGVYVQQKSEIRDSFKERYGSFVPSAILWIAGLFYWLIILNLGIGLFNLVPIGPLDGGRMLQLVCHKFFDTEKGNKVWYNVSLAFLFLVVINIVFAFIK